MNRRNFSRRPQKQQARGELTSIETDGPHREWLGMPDYFIHTLTVDGEEYSYLSADEVLDVKIGDTVVFRYQIVGTSKRIDKRSLGLWIDPATYNS
ncbi:hypothetical protein [Aestuariirhabdus litorea]|uniref:Uncharacterized protein n=1 Tax=Aestuariirhabdus litorea TaxID=2528527 RepID=A0A3P3VPY4_9GAMM|nr:hypothetical protein [Aestuariirhabdus litorea]RRJ84680.1 hypothetical protein D0544_06140 [Aestuariirhabdus litorea]RWW97903.1 hypothetical protein DZC74_06135 [Endozoicomonadaceae bacterium GTF-13]